MKTNKQTINQKNESIISKNLQGHYAVELYNGRAVYSDWDTLVKERFVEDPEIELKLAVLKKVNISPNEEVCMLFCVGCGEPMIYPIDAKEYPAFCKGRCKYNFEGEN